mgnify:CR=1 FL=1
MTSQNLNFYDLSVRDMMILNKKMPSPPQKISTDISNLPITLKLGIKVDLVDASTLHDVNKKIMMIGSRKITWGTDSTTLFIENPAGVYACVGDAHLARRYRNHIDGVFSSAFWATAIQEKTVDLDQRQGWCCAMFRKTEHRDYICELLETKLMDNFQGNEWFCYDQGHQFTNLFKFMFRLPHHHGNEHKEKIFTKLDKLNKIDPVENQLGPWHQQNLIELVPEGTMDFFEPTEKTIKPIAAGMPFVIIGCHKFLYKLRKIGFKTFHPFIDESYDVQPDWRLRTYMAMKSMFAFIKSSKNFKQVQEICKHNKLILQKIQTHDKDQRFIKKLRRLIYFDN